MKSLFRVIATFAIEEYATSWAIHANQDPKVHATETRNEYDYRTETDEYKVVIETYDIRTAEQYYNTLRNGDIVLANGVRYDNSRDVASRQDPPLQKIQFRIRKWKEDGGY